MFKRKQQVEEVVPDAPTAAPAEETVVDTRTTTYPQDDGETPAVQGHSRTTVYRQSLLWSRRTYDTVN